MAKDQLKKVNVFEANIGFLNTISRRKSYSKLFPEAPSLAQLNDDKQVEILQRIDEILKDERLSYPTATLVVNAPLALIQYGMEIELHTLQKIIGQPLTDINALRKGKKKIHG